MEENVILLVEDNPDDEANSAASRIEKEQYPQSSRGRARRE